MTDLCGKITDGTHFTPNYVSEGVPFISVKDVREFEISFDNTKYISKKEHEKLSKRCNPKAGDILLTKVGTIGLSAVVPDNCPEFSLFVSVCLIKPDNKIDPHFLCAVLNTSIARLQFSQSLKGVGVPDLHLENIAETIIPFPPIEKQQKLAAKMQAARESRRHKLAQADELLAGMDEFLFKQLGFTAPIKDHRFVFGVPISRVTSERIDPHFYHPYFVKLLTMIRQVYHKRLGEFVELSHEQWNPQKATEEVFNYIEISGVNRNTAEIYSTEVQTIEAPSRARMIVHTGDIIISLTRPHHGSIGIIDDDMDGYIASTGFAIIHKIKDNSVNPIYLWTILRSQICLQQMLQRSSGGNYPAITEDQILRISIPIPHIEIQDEIVKEHIRRSKNARRLCEEAERDWQRAKAGFEAQLFGEGKAL